MDTIEEFWARARASMGSADPGPRHGVRRIGNAPQLSENLLGMITRGEKTGLFSSPDEIQPVPAAGDHFVFTDYHGRPRCAVVLTECRRLRFCDVGPEQTACESPAARDLAAWREIHGRYWQRTLEAQGRSFTEDLPLLFQRFRVVYAEGPPPA